ncbi:hypothetical protein F5X68DRAFT_4035 [Plectosphaerella plurivora]|uniref:Uncharacterized protein n=1 Tax=Plectosphaerella plurivora TaxID=936078 RepID=A0A9P9AGK1_9PEZI|nr:hypothetical protein F5X68DRAFT_4035 [Plectosphaerella plurivora]
MGGLSMRVQYRVVVWSWKNEGTNHQGATINGSRLPRRPDKRRACVEGWMARAVSYLRSATRHYLDDRSGLSARSTRVQGGAASPRAGMVGVGVLFVCLAGPWTEQHRALVIPTSPRELAATMSRLDFDDTVHERLDRLREETPRRCPAPCVCPLVDH